MSVHDSGTTYVWEDYEFREFAVFHVRVQNRDLVRGVSEHVGADQFCQIVSAGGRDGG